MFGSCEDGMFDSWLAGGMYGLLKTDASVTELQLR